MLLFELVVLLFPFVEGFCMRLLTFCQLLSQLCIFFKQTVLQLVSEFVGNSLPCDLQVSFKRPHSFDLLC